MATSPSPHPGTTAPPRVDVPAPAAARAAWPRPSDHTPAPRRSASALPAIKGLLISPPGFNATLVDISASGLLAEWGLPTKIGQAVTVKFEGTFVPQSVEAQVVRSTVASLTSTGLRYHVAVEFTVPIAFEGEPPPAAAAEKAPAPAAVPDQPPPDDIVNRW